MQEAGIFPGVRVDVAVSDDGKAFTPAGSTSFDPPNNRAERGLTIKELPVEGTASGRYVKVYCKNVGVLPSWHEYAAVAGHMMIDEIMVNPE
jgi:hypothetical protein